MTLNEKFANNNIRMVLIPTAVVKKKTVDQSEEEKQREQQVDQERKYQIDAAIVKIMKARKTEKHQ